jgi:hypothetical protein
MSATTETKLPAELTKEQFLPTTPNIPDVCQTGDKECIARLVQAFSDCD